MESPDAVPPPQPIGGGQHIVFIYGSLLDNEILNALLKRVPLSSPAILHGYNRFSVEGCSYPAIIPIGSKKVEGKVLLEINDDELNLLDAFEDFEYERRDVEVSAVGYPGTLHASTYVWVEKNDPRLQNDWDLNDWRERHFEAFLQMALRFAAEYRSQHSQVGRLDI
ncbi:AIG2-like protein D [Wolffia australiana]